MSQVALSTMWGIGNFPDVAGFIHAASALGFDRFELNHGVDSAMLAGLYLNGYRIPSVHEPCPADVSMRTLKERNWLISAPDEENRQRGVFAVQRSIDLAHEVGAQVVVVHPGQVDVDPTLDATLRDLYKQGKSNTPEFVQVRNQFIAARAAQAEINLQSVRRSLVELVKYASEKHVRLGLENRYHYHEIPLPDELGDLLTLGDAATLGFWYDVGHAHVLERLGFYPHAEWLKRFSHRIVGVHLHDVIGIQDHHPAGTGEIDWTLVTRYLPADALRTCEFQNFNSAEQVAAGMRWLIEKGIVQP